MLKKASISLCRFFALAASLVLAAACTHPVDISGGGDISSISGTRDCAREEAPCNFVIQNAYQETYRAQPQSGFVFSHWQNCPEVEAETCSFNVSAEQVRSSWDTTAPTTTAHFLPAESLLMQAAESPVFLGNLEASFYPDIAYGEHARNRLDVFLPASEQATGLVVYVHGGGFVSGDKSLAYSDGGDGDIRRLLRAGVAFASVNYRYLQRNPLGLEALMRDVQRAVQFLRLHHRALNIDDSKVAIYGDSAGAGMALLLATRDEAALADAVDPVLRESSRVVAVAALETQASYDFQKWESVVFLRFGITLQNIVDADAGLKRRMQNALNIPSISNIDQPAVQSVRQDLDMLGWMSADDPDIYVANLAQGGGRPVSVTTLLHHPLHAKAVVDAATDAGIQTILRAPGLNLNSPSVVDHVEFLVNRLRVVQ